MGLWVSKEERLHEAAREGDKETVTRLLESGVSVNCSVGEKSLLYTTILSGRYELAKSLIKRGAVVTAGFYTDTPLHLASRMGAGWLVSYLLKCGASVNVADHNNCTPLWEAVAENKMASVKMLLRHPGIDVNQPCSDRFLKQGSANSPLMEAVESNNLELVSLLCLHGADLEQADSKRHKPLHRASFLGHSDLVEVLISRGSDVDAVDDNNITPFYLACERGYQNIAKMLMNAGCDVTLSRNTNGWKNKLFSPLHVAALNGHTEIVRQLCNIGAPVDQTEHLGKTPLILACNAGHFEIIEILLSSDADVNHRDVDGYTPLLYALQSCQRWLKRKFERSNLRITSRDQECKCERFSKDEDDCSVKAVKLLLKYGAEMNFRDNLNSSTPLVYNIVYGNTDTVCVLLQHGAEVCAEELHPEDMKWDNDSIAKLLVYYSRDFHEFAKSVCQSQLGIEMSDRCNEPSSLTHLCRLRVRRTLQKRTRRTIQPLVERLPLPSTLKQFLLFEEMNDILCEEMDNTVKHC